MYDPLEKILTRRPNLRFVYSFTVEQYRINMTQIESTASSRVKIYRQHYLRSPSAAAVYS